jgi:hypothetical protein
VVFSIQTRGNFGWRLSIQVVLHRFQRWKHGESSQNHQWRTTKYHFGDQWQVRPLVWNISVNSNRGLEHAMDIRKVCALVAHQRAETVACLSVRNCWIKSETTKGYSWSKQEMKPEFTVMTQKPNSSLLNGQAHPLNAPKKWGKSGQTWRACWLSF